VRRIAFAVALGLAVPAPFVAEAQPTWDRADTTPIALKPRTMEPKR
jgi:hypothetical protein